MSRTCPHCGQIVRKPKPRLDTELILYIYNRRFVDKDTYVNIADETNLTVHYVKNAIREAYVLLKNRAESGDEEAQRLYELYVPPRRNNKNSDSD